MKNRKLVRILAIVLVVLLVGGVIISALVSALADPAAAPGRDRYEISMEYMEAEQALQIEQRLVYVNRTGDRLDRVLFYAAPNMFRRESALMYENDDLEAVFPFGYAPGGVELLSVRVNGLAAEYGFQGENELYLRVACDLEAGETATFEFGYALLLTRCNAFIGVGETDVRLGAFCFIPGAYDDVNHEFVLNKPLPFTQWLYTDAADYDVSIVLPMGFAAASTGYMAREDDGAFHARAEGVRAFGLSFGRRWREATAELESGASVRLFSSVRDSAKVLRIAEEALSWCEARFGEGALPGNTLTIAQSDYPLGALNYPGYIALSGALLERSNEAELEKRIRFCVAQQYFGCAAYPEPSADAWLSDSVCEYLSYLMLEQAEGHEAFLKAINRDWVSALQLTIPGGLRVTSDAALFDSGEYGIVVLRRGAVVLHELRLAMGLEPMLDGLRRFYELSRGGDVLTEMDLVRCMDDASGKSWEDFLTDWVFNVGDYVEQHIDWFE